MNTINKVGKVIVLGLVAVCYTDVNAEGTIVGWRETAELNSTSASTRLTIGDNGEVNKLGDSVQSLSLSNVDRQAPYAINVVSGRLDIVAGAATKATATPAFIAEKAAFWVDANTGCGLQTEQVGTNTHATRWCDCRETNPENRTYISAFLPMLQRGLPMRTLPIPW